MGLFQKLFGKKKSAKSGTNPRDTIDPLPQMPEERFAGLSSDERLKAIMTLGDTGSLKYYDLLSITFYQTQTSMSGCQP